MVPCREAAKLGAKGSNISKLGDDLIESLKEAVAHTKGNDPGIVHSRDPEGDDAEEETTRATNDVEPVKTALIGFRESE